MRYVGKLFGLFCVWKRKFFLKTLNTSVMFNKVPPSAAESLRLVLHESRLGVHEFIPEWLSSRNELLFVFPSHLPKPVSPWDKIVVRD